MQGPTGQDRPPGSGTQAGPETRSRLILLIAAATFALLGVPAAALPVPADAAPLPGEATWCPGRTADPGTATVYTGYFRPDPTVRASWPAWTGCRSGSTRAHLVAGTVQPGGRFPGNAAIPAGGLPKLVATFNSGWRMKDITGGCYLQGRTAKPLIDGQATAAIDDRGHLTVGRWGRSGRQRDAREGIRARFVTKTASRLNQEPRRPR